MRLLYEFCKQKRGNITYGLGVAGDSPILTSIKGMPLN